jgi:hypothetical protein
MPTFKVNKDLIANKQNPEWGRWRVLADKGKWYEISSNRGARVLFKNETKDWKKVN